MQGYERDPRSLAKRAEAYLKSTGIADSALFGPENEFFIFDSVRWGADMRGCLLRGRLDPGVAWNSDKAYEEGNKGHRPGRQGRLLSGSPGRCLPGHPRRDVQGLEEMGARSRGASPRSGHRPGSARSASASIPW